MDIKRLILLVADHRELYDKHHKDYKNAEKREDLWRAIAMDLGVHSDVVKQKWRGLRDTYTRRKREDDYFRSRSPSPRKPWKYMKLLEFLEPTVEFRRNLLPSEEIYMSPIGGSDVEEEESSLTSASAMVSSVRSDVSRMEGKKRTRLDSPEVLLSCLESRLTERLERKREKIKKEEENTDNTYNFCMSLIPSLRSLPPHRKSSMQLRIYQMLHEEIHGHLAPLSNPVG